MMSLTWSIRSALVMPNRSADALHAYKPAPVSAIISTNSGMEGISSCSILWFMYDVKAEEGEEEVRLHSLRARTVGHDQARVDAFERALGNDDGDLFDLGAQG